MNKLKWITFFCLTFIIFGCSKKIFSPRTSQLQKGSELAIEEIDFEYLQGKARLSLSHNNKMREVKATVRIRKDSVIWMVFSVVGVQGGKALIDKDSITIVNSVDKEYYVFEYEELSRRYNFPINYSVIQSAMIGNLILPQSEKDDVKEDNSHHKLLQHLGSILVTNSINAASHKIENVEMTEEGSSNVFQLLYNNFQPLEDKYFPYNGTINLAYKTPAGALNTTIIFEYSKVEVGDKELKFPFNIPKKYDRR
jgi:hypothetical protein